MKLETSGKLFLFIIGQAMFAVFVVLSSAIVGYYRFSLAEYSRTVDILEHSFYTLKYLDEKRYRELEEFEKKGLALRLVYLSNLPEWTAKKYQRSREKRKPDDILEHRRKLIEEIASKDVSRWGIDLTEEQMKYLLEKHLSHSQLIRVKVPRESL